MILKMVRNVDDAEDLTIESFAKSFRSLHRFKKDFTFSTWLFRIATNNTIDFIRKKKLNTLSIENTFTDDDGQAVSIDVEDENLDPQEEAESAAKGGADPNICLISLPAKVSKSSSALDIFMNYHMKESLWNLMSRSYRKGSTSPPPGKLMFEMVE